MEREVAVVEEESVAEVDIVTVAKTVTELGLGEGLCKEGGVKREKLDNEKEDVFESEDEAYEASGAGQRDARDVVACGDIWAAAAVTTNTDDEEVTGAAKGVTEKGRNGRAEEGQGEVEKLSGERGALTVWDSAVGAALELELVLLLAAPKVPEGARFRRMYPKSPLEVEPHDSKPKPGHFSSQSPIEVVSAGT